MVAADGEAVAVAAEQEDVEIGPGQADAAGIRDGAAMDEVRAVAVHEIREARGTADPGQGTDLLVFDILFLEHFVERSQNSKISATGTPRRVVGRDCLLG